MWDGKPQFLVKPPVYATPAVTGFVRGKLAARGHTLIPRNVQLFGGAME